MNKSRARPIVLTAIAFGALGPILGTLLFFGGATLLSVHGVDLSLGDLKFVAAATVYAYFFAMVPAASAGAVAAALAAPCKFASDRFKLRRFIVGAAAGGACAALWQFTALHGELADPLLFFKVGAVAGAVLAMFFPRQRWLLAPSNNALERERGRWLR